MDNTVASLPIKTIAGETVTLSQFQGKKPVYLKFWASWCQPCRHEMPELQRIYGKYGKDIQILAVNLGINENLPAIKATQREFGLTLPMAIDESGALAQAFNLTGTPYHVLLNRQGRVVYEHQGELKPGDIMNKLGLLASATLPELESKPVADAHMQDSLANIRHEPLSAVFFHSTWCDWYLQDSRQAMARNCVDAQQQINLIAQHYPQLAIHGLVTRLWTGSTELEEYKKRVKPAYPLSIDETNAAFFRFQVKQVPTLVLLKQGREVARIEQFGDSAKVLAQVRQALPD